MRTLVAGTMNPPPSSLPRLPPRSVPRCDPRPRSRLGAIPVHETASVRSRNIKVARAGPVPGPAPAAGFALLCGIRRSQSERRPCCVSPCPQAQGDHSSLQVQCQSPLCSRPRVNPHCAWPFASRDKDPSLTTSPTWTARHAGGSSPPARPTQTATAPRRPRPPRFNAVCEIPLCKLRESGGPAPNENAPTHSERGPECYSCSFAMPEDERNDWFAPATARKERT